MPLISHTKLTQNIVLAVWHITEAREALSCMLTHQLAEHTHRKENIHWLASRILLQQVFVNDALELIKDENNKPSLFVNKRPFHISITHSFDYAAIIVSNVNEVGVDLERIDERVLRVASKFLNEREKHCEQNVFLSTLVWSSKETLYKLYGKKELDFKRNMTIEVIWDNLQNLIVKGRLHKDEMQYDTIIYLERLNGYILTYAWR
jgi:4'-phosphopantetheinyl transferase